MVGTPVSPQGHQQFHASVDDFLIATQTYQMEFDVYNVSIITLLFLFRNLWTFVFFYHAFLINNILLLEQPVGRLLACFVREFGSEISDYVILRDPNHNEFEVRVVKESGKMFFSDGWHVLKDAYNIKYGAWITLLYISPTLLTIRVLTRWCFEVHYPSYKPPLRLLLFRSDSRCKIGSSVVNVCSGDSSRPKTPILSFVKQLTLYDIHSGLLVITKLLILLQLVDMCVCVDSYIFMQHCIAGFAMVWFW
jgi:hypothetical protein